VEAHRCVICEVRASYACKEEKLSTLIGRGGLQGCEMLRMPYCLDIIFTDVDKFVSFSYRPGTCYFYSSVDIFQTIQYEPNETLFLITPDIARATDLVSAPFSPSRNTMTILEALLLSDLEQLCSFLLYFSLVSSPLLPS
jgi:hypothetical protein